MISAGLLITGNEVLSAKTKDTNGPFIGMHLRNIGVSVRASITCGDDENDLLDCLNYLAQKSDIILMTGGLGPTSDDLTADVVAKFFGIPVEFNQTAWDACCDFFIKSGRTQIPESNKKQASLPKNCELLPNKLGTAAGFSVTGEKFSKKVTVYCMPGVPYEMEGMFLEFVLPKLEEHSFLPVTLNWQVFFLGESFMQNAINAAEKSLLKKYSNASVSYQAHPYYVSYSVTLFANSDIEKIDCENYLKNIFTPEVKKAFGSHILYSDVKKVVPYLTYILKQNHLSIAFAETSCAGFLSKEFSILTNDFDVFKGSIASNSDFIKKYMLKIPEEVIQNQLNSPESMVSYLAANTLKEMKSDICLAEYGFPTDPYLKDEKSFNGFFLAIALSKEKFLDIPQIENKISEFSWKLNNSFHQNNIVVFHCFIKLNKRHHREIQQTRATLYLLCSLAKVLV